MAPEEVFVMVLWCKNCNAFLGLRDPVKDWTIDRMGVCQRCFDKQLIRQTPESLCDVEDGSRTFAKATKALDEKR